MDLGQGKPDFHGSFVARTSAAKFCIGEIDSGIQNQYGPIQVISSNIII